MFSVWRDFANRLPQVENPSFLDQILEFFLLDGMQRECLKLLRESKSNLEVLSRASILLGIDPPKPVATKTEKKRLSRYAADFTDVLGLQNTLAVNGYIRGGLLDGLPNISILGIENVTNLAELRNLLSTISKIDAPLFTRSDRELLDYLDNLRKLCSLERQELESRSEESLRPELNKALILQKLTDCVRK